MKRFYGQSRGGWVAKSTDREILKKLRAFLDAKEPRLVYFLVRIWNGQENAITYKEIREAILSGELQGDMLLQWQEDYTQFVVDYLQPLWMEAMEKANEEKRARFPEWEFDPHTRGVLDWTKENAARFVTNSSQTQLDGLQAVIQRAALLEDMNVDQLARAIRPMVGLTKPQTVANINYYQNLLASGTSKKRALELSVRYSARQHRYRAYNIARTELAFAYNQGSYEGTKQAQEAGYMGDTVKRWLTADDERVCPICGALEGKVVAMEEEFLFPTKLEGRLQTIRRVPPAHPSCRCAVAFEEVSPPLEKDAT